MALNPAYAQQTTRTRPFCLGYVYAQGEKVNSILGFDGTTVEQYILGSGEWDSCLYLSMAPGDVYIANWGVGTVGQYGSSFAGHTSVHDKRLFYYHFHRGSYAARGLPLNLISLGPDQGSDSWMQYFPSVTPALCFSGIAYYFVRATTSGSGMNPVGIYASTRCRIFDASGNVTGYGFTTNPTWQMIETILRFQLKCQQPGLAGLTNAEKACFDWPAIVAHAARNSFVLPNGRPRFTGNFAFAADSTLAAMMEAQLRNCRSFKRERGSVISFVGDDARTPVFAVSRRHLVPENLKLEKKDLSTAPNVYVPQFRDLEIPAVAQVASVTSSQQTAQGGITSWVQTFITVGPQPFFSRDYFAYSGSADDADFAGDYGVNYYSQTVNGVTSQTAPPIANQFDASSPLGLQQSAGSTTGGYLGTQQSRFKQRAPTGVQHRSHQRSLGQVAPGITPLPRQRPVQYDLGNNTFDQTNRLMKFMRDRDLGPDGLNWISPLRGSLAAFASAVDVNGNALAAVEEGDVILLDDTASVEFTGQFEVLEIETTTAFGSGGDRITLTLQSYFESAATDISDPPGNSYQTLPNSLLPMADALVSNPFWLMEADVTGAVASDGTITISVPGLSIWWLGDALPTVYTGVQLAGLTANAQVILYLNVTTKTAPPTITADTKSTYPPYPLPAGQIVLFMGKLTPGAGTGGGGTGVTVRPGGGPVGGPVPGPTGAN